MFNLRFVMSLICLLTSLSVKANSDVLRVATEASYPPFETLDNNQQLQGFDIDLVRSLCVDMERSCVFSNQSFDSLIPSLQFGRFDLVISALDITPERLQRVAFSKPYLENSAVFIAKGALFDSQLQLHHKVIAVQNGTSQQDYLIDKFVHYGTIVVPYESYQGALDDLLKGKNDAVFIDRAVAVNWLSAHPDHAIVGEPILEPDYFGAGLGIAVKQGNDALLKAINKSLNKLRRNGEFKRIYQRYFGRYPELSHS
jgi:arginine transport system substrate-binding protein